VTSHSSSHEVRHTAVPIKAKYKALLINFIGIVLVRGSHAFPIEDDAKVEAAYYGTTKAALRNHYAR
jgi:hypothetical protein